MLTESDLANTERERDLRIIEGVNSESVSGEKGKIQADERKLI